MGRRACVALALLTGAQTLAAQTMPAQTGSHIQTSSPTSIAEAQGDKLFRAFQTERAIMAYRAGLGSDPDNVELLGKLSFALSSHALETEGFEGDEELLEESLMLARRTVELAPNLSRGYSNLSISLARYGRVIAHTYKLSRAREVADMGKEALAACRKAKLLDPYDHVPYIILGIYEREAADLHPIVRIMAKTLLGYTPKGTFEESEIELTRAAELEPTSIVAHYELGVTYVSMERLEEAKRHLETAIMLPPKSQMDRLQVIKAKKVLAEIS